MDKEVKSRVDFLNQKYECVICPAFMAENQETVCVLYKDQSIEEFDIVADNKCKFMVELTKHFRNKWGR